MAAASHSVRFPQIHDGAGAADKSHGSLPPLPTSSHGMAAAGSLPAGATAGGGTSYHEMEPPQMPPVLSESDFMSQGVRTYRNLRKYCETVLQLMAHRQREHTETLQQGQALAQELHELRIQVAVGKDAQANLKLLEQQREQEQCRHADMAMQLKTEKTKRRQAEVVCERLGQELQRVTEAYSAYQQTVTTDQSLQAELKARVDQQQAALMQARAKREDDELELDSLRVSKMQLERIQADREKQCVALTETNAALTASETATREKNAALQTRLRQCLEANADLTIKYTQQKKEYDAMKIGWEEQRNELEETRHVCHLAIRQRKQMQAELQAATLARSELQQKADMLEITNRKKERDLSDLVVKVNETIGSYEQKLEKKEEQIWVINMQLQEAKEMSERATRAHGVVSAKDGADGETEVERRFQSKERGFQNEIRKLTNTIKQQEEQIAAHIKTVEHLTARQHYPRMERLKKLEQDLHNRLERYIMADVQATVRLTCPRDLMLLHKPTTLVPCGHTFCHDCVHVMQEENFSKLQCQECGTVATATIRNEALEAFAESFNKRKEETTLILDWMKDLESVLLTDSRDGG
ncbi:hypothetical protein CXG81DRAFT_26191 [Caulochytrium protostelioides]|uniref:Zinc finger RING-type eukaryotic domain-containing protein n=1 Tax=Caulochytrium protostelioides TaxID=1555241 RepID=A0A4P9WTH8_9FUNG|nr:hypothetical protein CAUPRSCDRAFT_11803 [Caulochytrium protostelioides]RKP01132.1 hypothetical protein CXG81DRAFT_26191 [Caulochytrium protostelioides]|eukprot:RKP01132.1 hypothetical protein CXG81DRAFT_26191 [Caulochytrium protostelioides]